MLGHLNLYEPYDRKDARHEDALTRAFLLVLRGVPVAHAAWLHLVDQAHRTNGGGGAPPLYTLPAPTIHMQTAKVPEGVARVLSIVQTDEEVFRIDDAAPSDRRQVLDAVISYGKLAVVVENKPFHGHIWHGQLDVNIPVGVEHDPRVATITWSSIVSAWGRLLEAGHLGPAEALLLGDFLDYVEMHFPRLRPYSRVGLCGDDHDRLSRRCRAILTDLSDEASVSHHRGWGWYIDLPDGQCARKIGFFPEGTGEDASLCLEFDPGDTAGQARLFYDTCSCEEMLALLQRERWRAWPIFHLMYMTTGFFRPKPRQSVAEYWNIWQSRRELIRQWRREEFNAAFAALAELGVVDETDREEFERSTHQTKRKCINFAPGITFRWYLPLDEAAVLDRRDELVDVVRTAVEEGTAALKLTLPGAFRRSTG